jgi:hypothetical protein
MLFVLVELLRGERSDRVRPQQSAIHFSMPPCQMLRADPFILWKGWESDGLWLEAGLGLRPKPRPAPEKGVEGRIEKYTYKRSL